jgi:formylglycine-generating enzyme required for sulfatase activity
MSGDGCRSRRYFHDGVVGGGESWAAAHGGSAEAVADESPQREVNVKSFGLGKYDVTRAEFAVFARDTSHSAQDGCGRDSFKWNKEPDLSWQSPGFVESDRDRSCASTGTTHEAMSPG